MGFLQFLDKEQEDTDEDLDFRALENGFVSQRHKTAFPANPLSFLEIN